MTTLTHTTALLSTVAGAVILLRISADRILMFLGSLVLFVFALFCLWAIVITINYYRMEDYDKRNRNK